PFNAALRAQTDAWFQQGQAWLGSLEEVYRLQVTTTHLALKRFEELQQRLQKTESAADTLALQGEAVQFEAAAALRYAQELFDIGMRGMAGAGAQLADAALKATPPMPRLDLGLPLGLLHTGIRPIDDLYGAALNRYLI
ncbi:MAG: phasin family protein, partial [Pseudomonadota bacterium]